MWKLITGSLIGIPSALSAGTTAALAPPQVLLARARPAGHGFAGLELVAILAAVFLIGACAGLIGFAAASRD